MRFHEARRQFYTYIDVSLAEEGLVEAPDRRYNGKGEERGVMQIRTPIFPPLYHTSREGGLGQMDLGARL